jgi:ribosome-associated heat shock protein Hsp15
MDHRIDKYLWCIRVFKTRSEAAEACQGNKVQVNGNNAKPSKLVKPGDEITVRKGPAQLSYRVKLGLNNRVGAALVSNYVENITPESELAKLHAPTETFFVRRDKGSGRPTKKERRILEELWDSVETL